jgi:hypothetical protein
MRAFSWWYPVVLALGSVALTACPPFPPPPPGPDSSPPGFLAVDIRLERRDGQVEPPTGGISILNADVTRVISPSYRIRITASAGDPQSGIAKIELATVSGTDGQGVTKQRNLSWSCIIPPPGGVLVGILELAAMTPTPPLSPFANPSVAGIDVTVDPIGQANCGNGASGLGGFVRVLVTNGAGLVTASKTFLFDYQ